MSEIIDENGFDFSDSYNPLSMTADDAISIAKDFQEVFITAIDALEDVAIGRNYDKGETTLNDVISSMLNGSQFEFFRAATGIVDPAHRDSFRTQSSRQTTTDKNNIIALYDTIALANDLRNDLISLLQDLLRGPLKTTVKLVQFNHSMQDLGSDTDLIDSMNTAYKQFDQFRTRINSSRIFDELYANRDEFSGSKEQYWQIIERGLNRTLNEYSDLARFVMSVTRTNPSGYNKFYAVDILTRGFGPLRKEKENLKALYDTSMKLTEKAYKMDNGSYLHHEYYYGFKNLLAYTSVILKRAVEIIENYEQIKNPENELIHYPSEMKGIMSKYSFQSVYDPLEEGTAFSILIKEMQDKIYNLSMSVYREMMKDINIY